MSQGQPFPPHNTQHEYFLTPPTSPALESFCLPLDSGCSQHLNYGSGWERKNIMWLTEVSGDMTWPLWSLRIQGKISCILERTRRSLPTESHLNCLEGPFSLSTGFRPTFGTWPHHQQPPLEAQPDFPLWEASSTYAMSSLSPCPNPNN